MFHPHAPRLGLYSLFTAAFIVVSSTILGGEAAGKKAPVPDAAVQSKAQGLLREVYGKEYDEADTPEQKTALAQKMLAQAAKTKGDPASHFVLLRVAKDVAVAAGDVETAFEAVTQIVGTYDVDAMEMKEETLRAVAEAARTTSQFQTIAQQALPLIEEATDLDEYERAGRLGELGASLARRARDYTLLKQIVERSKEVEKLAAAYAEVRKAREVLEQDPTDPDANLAVGRYLCLVKGDWEKGIPMLALGSDAEVKALAAKELEGAMSVDAEVALGDGWWELAETKDEREKEALMLRAGSWYRAAQVGLSGLVKAKVDGRLKDIVKLGRPIPAKPSRVFPLGQWVDVLKELDTRRDVVKGEWKRTEDGITVAPEAAARMMLPVRVKGSYELKLELTRKEGASVLFPVGLQMCSLWVARKKIALELVDGRTFWGDETENPSRSFVPGERCGVSISVQTVGDAATVEAELDMTNRIRWSGKTTSFQMDDKWKLPELSRPGLGSYFGATFHSMEVRLVSGEASWVQPADTRPQPNASTEDLVPGERSSEATLPAERGRQGIPSRQQAAADRRESKLALASLRADIGRVVTKKTEAGAYLQYVPAAWFQKLEILAICHGTFPKDVPALKDAYNYLRRWIPTAEQFGLVLVAPAFDQENFGGHVGPDGWGYRALTGKTVDADDFLIQSVDQYKVVDREFDGRFYLYGHSAGGQFVNRFCVMHPDRLKAVVLSGAASYAFPDSDAQWPLGMKPLRRTVQWGDVAKSIEVIPDPQTWIAAAGVPVTVVVGSNDTTPLKHAANQGGETRIERGRHWVDEMNALARRNGMKEQYRFVLVPNADHHPGPLTPAAIQAFVERQSE